MVEIWIFKDFTTTTIGRARGTALRKGRPGEGMFWREKYGIEV
jgi:hypothetical protein